MTYPDLSLNLRHYYSTGFSPRELLIQFLLLKVQDFRNFVLHTALSYLTLNNRQRPEVYNSCHTFFRTLRESENTRTCENCTLFACNSHMSHDVSESENTRTCENCTRKACNSRMSVCFLTRAKACSSRMSVCFLTRATCKNVRQNLIPRSTCLLDKFTSTSSLK